MLRRTLFRLATNNERKQQETHYKAAFPTQYDFDKERAAANQSFTTLDCIMETDISPPNWNSIAGLKKRWALYVSQKRLSDRRPDLTVDILKHRYIDYKKLSHSYVQEELNKLGQFTPAGEAERIKTEQSQKIQNLVKKGSWKKMSSGMATGYQIEVTSFDIVACYYGQMTMDDWLQLNFRASSLETTGTGPTKITTPLVEYPVMEIRLTDGVLRPNNYAPTVVAVMDNSGSRYGRDGQDAVMLRKALGQGRKWYS